MWQIWRLIFPWWKKPGLSVWILNTTVRSHHVSKENADHCGKCQILFLKKCYCLFYIKNFHSVGKIILTLIMMLHIFSSWVLYVVNVSPTDKILCFSLFHIDWCALYGKSKSKSHRNSNFFHLWSFYLKKFLAASSLETS